jgi:integrase
MAKSTRSGRKNKPAKPYPDFPLFAHDSGRWAKKIRGKLHYFGWWRGNLAAPWQAALSQYQEQRDDLHAGRTPRVKSDGLALRDLVNRYLTAKRHLLDTREITPRTFQDYYQTCEVLIAQFGRDRLVADLAADDFERLRAALSERWGPVRLSNVINMIRGVFKFGYDAGMIDKPIRYGPGFKRPSKKVLRLARAARGPRMFEPAEIHTLLAAVSTQLRAMVLLGINCGFGNTDVATLPIDALDLDGGWANFPRPKTGIPRRCPLWPETVAALKESLAVRPLPKDEADSRIAFVTKYGWRWVKTNVEHVKDDAGKPDVHVSRDDGLTKEVRKILRALGINGSRNFYTLRHTFRTVADEWKDQPAIDSIMGHARDDMASVYRERISDERLRAVTDYVRNWLFGDVSTPTLKLADVGDDDRPHAQAAV